MINGGSHWIAVFLTENSPLTCSVWCYLFSKENVLLSCWWMIHKLREVKKILSDHRSFCEFGCLVVLDLFFMKPLWWYLLKYIFALLLQALKMTPVTAYCKGGLSLVPDTPWCHPHDFSTDFPKLSPCWLPAHFEFCLSHLSEYLLCQCLLAKKDGQHQAVGWQGI